MIAQLAIIPDDCASVQLVRTKKLDLSTTAVVLDSMMTAGIRASVKSDAPGSRSAVRPPPMTSTLSLTMSSCSRRFPVSGDEAPSLINSSICLPATLSPCCLIYRRAPATTCCPAAASPPVIGITIPTFTGFWAFALASAEIAMARIIAVRTMHRFNMAVLHRAALCSGGCADLARSSVPNPG